MIQRTFATTASPSPTTSAHLLSERVDAMTGVPRAAELFLASLLGLFLEVLLIRWHASELRAAAYFKNLTLLAAFLGLGMGFSAARRDRLSTVVAPLALLGQVVALALLDAAGIDRSLRLPSRREFMWDVTTGLGRDALFRTIGFYGFFVLLYASTIVIFMPIGQLIGRLMTRLPPLRAYSLNVAGSLAGVALFAGLSALWTPPVVWFGLAGVMLVWLLRHERMRLTITGVSVACLLAAVAVPQSPALRAEIHSPYQRLEIDREVLVNDRGERLDIGAHVLANKAYHLRALNLHPEFVEFVAPDFPRLAAMAGAYDLPYVVSPRFERVLVLGAGAGNDVAAALRNGATRVDAVEIDPAIVRIGEARHPERPYDDPRVTVHIDDARAYLRHSGENQYDLIVFGLLDSHTLLSGMSAVRLENFVYTLEALEEARRVLRPDGILVLTFSIPGVDYLAGRFHHMLERVFGTPPRVFRLQYDLGVSLVVGAEPTAAGLEHPGVEPIEVTPDPQALATTDDWPFLYLRSPSWRDLPTSYLVLVGTLALLSIVWIRSRAESDGRIQPHFFFLGGAFLLIETKGITELALIFGATWIVSSVVIFAILALILAANLFVAVFPEQNRRVHYALLAVSLLAGYVVPVSRLLEWSWWLAAVGSTTLLVLPLFFAGVIFATSLTRTASVPQAMASNLLGAILGGFLEYSSLFLGFRNLYLLSLVVYGLSMLRMPGLSQRD